MSAGSESQARRMSNNIHIAATHRTSGSVAKVTIVVALTNSHSLRCNSSSKTTSSLQAEETK
eukprot:5813716-Amphidinium_carterae.1